MLGTKTFGKGSVQTIMPIDNAGALRLTTALYFTPSGKSIQDYGVTPDVVVSRYPRRQDAFAQLRETDLLNSFTNPSGQSTAPLPAGTAAAAVAKTIPDKSRPRTGRPSTPATQPPTSNSRWR